MDKYMLRIHTARMETRYGVDTAKIFDDPNDPKYTDDEVLEKLMEALKYTPDESEKSGYPGFYDNEIGAYFDYDGYMDVEIPESLIRRIISDASTEQASASAKALEVKASGGYFRADLSQDEDYPGIDVEFISDNEDEQNLSRPRVLFEKPVGGQLRALIWNNPQSEDYEEEVLF